MTLLRSTFYFLLKLPLTLLVRCKAILAEQMPVQNENKHLFYILHTESASDILTLQNICQKKGLPDPLDDVIINSQKFSRTLYIEKSTPIFNWRKKSVTNALQQSKELLSLHNENENLDIQIIPVNLNWGRKPTKEKNTATFSAIFSEQQSPSWLHKLFTVIFFGRHTLLRFSNALSLRELVSQHGSDAQIARKLLRITRFHFYRQTIAASGPRLMHRQQMFTALLANPAIKKVIAEEMKIKKISEARARKNALNVMNEIAGDYSISMVRVGERILNKLWNRLYSGITVNNGERLRALAEDGQEIIYVPCHRSHMDYLLLTYVIYNQGLVTPRIAAGINLNFWPAGPIFRKAGAFFIRRSFGGNRLYSAIFREYLGLLFERGYSVKYYTEGGRSRTGRLLAPKTGMLAMTVQSLLRGVKRPLTLVPVYIGYEHVMEVATYHKELSGNKKKSESIWGVLKAIKNLRNYGKGFVNFGEPININQFLNNEVPNWQADINNSDQQKPQWLTPSVNLLSEHVMTNINNAVALNGISLISLILLTNENKALDKTILAKQIDFFLSLQQHVPYHKELTLPEGNGEDLINDAISLNKVIVTDDALGSVISLNKSSALEMSYYRNNILHAFILPSLICRLLNKNEKIANSLVIEQTQQLIAIIKHEFFLWQSDDDVKEQVVNTLHFLEEQHIIKHSKAGFWSLHDGIENHTRIFTMSKCIEATIQRLVIVSQLIEHNAPMPKSTLESKMVVMANRLAILNNIHAPEFVDKKAQSSLINQMKKLHYIEQSDDDVIIMNDTLQTLTSLVSKLVDVKVLQTLSTDD